MNQSLDQSVVAELHRRGARLGLAVGTLVHHALADVAGGRRADDAEHQGRVLDDRLLHEGLEGTGGPVGGGLVLGTGVFGRVLVRHDPCLSEFVGVLG